MKLNYYYLSFFLFMCLIAGANYLVELNAYTPPGNESEITVMGQEGTVLQIVDYPISPITLEEYCVDSQNQPVACHQLKEIQNGDILVSKSSHTLLFRHGYAAIVVDAKAGLVIEALGYGAPSMIQSLDKWNYYPTVKVLRLKERTDEMMNELVETAKTQFLDLNYNILAKKNNLSTTHCSDIVWKVFNEFGYDLDSNGGAFVTPQDIANSPYLDVIESYGFPTDRDW